jgi:hypothetical protein
MPFPDGDPGTSKGKGRDIFDEEIDINEQQE